MPCARSSSGTPLGAPHRNDEAARGSLAEQLFDPEFRRGSSLDEVVMAQLVSGQAALLLGRDGEQYWHSEIWRWTGLTLQARRAAVKDISSELFAKHHLDGPRIAEIMGAEPAAAPPSASP